MTQLTSVAKSAEQHMLSFPESCHLGTCEYLCARRKWLKRTSYEMANHPTLRVGILRSQPQMELHQSEMFG